MKNLEIDLTVVLPVYRNEASLCLLYVSLTQTLLQMPVRYEIMFVNDASPDGSKEILEEFSRRDQHVSLVDLPERVGQQKAVIEGIDKANGLTVVIMDADLQDSVEAIPHLYTKLSEGYDAVFAGRRGRYESTQRLLTSRLFKLLIHYLTGLPVDAGIFVILSRRMVDRVLNYRPRNPFLVAMIGCSELPVSSISVERSVRSMGGSAYSIFDRFRVGTLAVVWVVGHKLKKRWLNIRQKVAGRNASSFPQTLEEFNKLQMNYFHGTEKKTMRPRNDNYLRRHVEEAVRASNISPGQRVLEVGCGMGRYTFYLAAQGFELDALDLTPWLLKKLEEYNGKTYDIRIHCRDIQKPIPELEGKFDVVIGFFTLHHVFDLTAAFKIIATLLKPGGRMVFVEPNPFNILYYIQLAITPGMTWRGDRGILRMRKGVIFDATLHANLASPVLSRFGFFPPFLANLSWGARFERMLEKIAPLRPLCAFQLFKAVKKP